MTDSLSPAQFSDYDERPDPKKPGQQGVLFRKLAPAQDQDKRQHLVPAEYGHYVPKGGNPHDYPQEMVDDRIAKGRATGFVPSGGELYHGTAANLKPGSMVKPAGWDRPANFEGNGYNKGHGITQDPEHEHAFATPDLGSAYRFGKIAQETRTGQGMTGKPHVFRVQPVGPVQLDREVRDTAQDMARNYGDGMPMGDGGEEGGDEMAFQSKQGFKVTGKVPLAHAQEAYRSYNEDELGQEPGSYEFAPKPEANQMYGKYY